MAIASARQTGRPPKHGEISGLAAMNALAAEAAANGLTEEKLAELLKQPD